MGTDADLGRTAVVGQGIGGQAGDVSDPVIAKSGGEDKWGTLPIADHYIVPFALTSVSLP